MGGLGSGRPYEGRPRVGVTRQVKVGDLAKMGALTEGWKARLSWGDATCEDMRGEYAEDTLRLSWKVETEDKDGHYVVSIPIRISWSPCNYGGQRPWLLCPYCGRRVSALHLSSNARQLACRHCFRMTYATRNTDDQDRLHIRRRKLFRRLGAKGSIDRYTRIPRRPKGMWRSTYDRIKEQIIQTEMDLDDAFMASAGPLISRILKRYPAA